MKKVNFNEKEFQYLWDLLSFGTPFHGNKWEKIHEEVFEKIKKANLE